MGPADTAGMNQGPVPMGVLDPGDPGMGPLTSGSGTGSAEGSPESAGVTSRISRWKRRSQQASQGSGEGWLRGLVARVPQDVVVMPGQAASVGDAAAVVATPVESEVAVQEVDCPGMGGASGTPEVAHPGMGGASVGGDYSPGYEQENPGASPGFEETASAFSETLRLRKQQWAQELTAEGQGAGPRFPARASSQASVTANPGMGGVAGSSGDSSRSGG